jgi:isopentenyl-diphosphate delta-isomerase
MSRPAKPIGGEGRPAVSFEDEPLICVDADDAVVRHLSKGDCHDGQGVLHRALSVFLFDRHGRLLLQQRSAKKRLWPLWWANSCCSHPRRGEAVAAAARRRLGEELGVQTPLTFTHRFEYHAPYGDAGSEHELCHVFVGQSDAPIRAHDDEIAATAWWRPEDLDAALADEAAPFTPWLRLEWAALRNEHWGQIERLVARPSGERPR